MSLKINDRVKFYVEKVLHEGVVNLIEPSGTVRINALCGEFRRKISDIILIE